MDQSDYKATKVYASLSRIHRLWVDLALAINSVKEGEDIFVRIQTLPWESPDPDVVQAWEALVAPENLADLVDWGSGDLNPRARAMTDLALEFCRRNSGVGES